jgi:hypothetical protein
MSSPHEPLLQLCRQWRELTLGEGAAIEDDAWDDVARCQREKEILRSRIDQWADGSPESSHVRAHPEIRLLVGEIIAMEQRNAAALAGQRRQAEARQDECDRTGRTLRRVHGAYAGRSDTGWQRYT